MKILLLNLYYPPDTSATAKMAQTVVDTVCIHHRVTVLCGRPSYDPRERLPWRLYQTENVDLVRIIRAGSTAFPRFNMKKRLLDRKSTRLNSSHMSTSYAVFCLKKKINNVAVALTSSAMLL